jgi:integrase
MVGQVAAPYSNLDLRIFQIEGNPAIEQAIAFEDRRMRAVVMAWRDGWAVQPRSADKASVTLATLLGWAVQRGLLTINVAAKIPHLHSADRAEIIWTAADWSAIAGQWTHGHGAARAITSPELMNALRLAHFTALRLGDLVALDWDQVGSKAIILTTRKRKRRAVIPIFPELATLGTRKGKVWSTAGARGGQKAALAQSSSAPKTKRASPPTSTICAAPMSHDWPPKASPMKILAALSDGSWARSAKSATDMSMKPR